MTPYKFQLTAGNVTRFFALFISLLVLVAGLMVHNAINTWLDAKHATVNNVAQALQKRIDSYRFATWQIYENLSLSPAGTSAIESPQESRLRPDIYALEKNRRRTEALIFGAHDNSTLSIAQRTSNYLDTLWGAENGTWNMYFLNGADNSLVMVSTLPLKDMVTRYKDNSISGLVEGRRAEMLQQANALDERESFSPLRRLSWQNERYFTVLTTFNQPGHLATVVAFDLPVNDIIPEEAKVDNFQLRQPISANAEGIVSTASNKSVNINWVNSNFDITAALPGTPLELIYRVPIIPLLLNTLHNLFWSLFTLVSLAILSLAGMVLLRQQPLRSRENHSAERDVMRQLNEEIFASLPIGLLVFDFANNRALLSNTIAEHLLPHLNLQKIINMSDQHQGVLQATVNNEVFEIRHTRSTVAPNTQLFMMRDQDRELLVSKKLQTARQVLDKSHRARQRLLHNLGRTLHEPLKEVQQRLTALVRDFGSAPLLPALESVEIVKRLTDDIFTLDQLETSDWTPEITAFNVQAMLDDIAEEILPYVLRKGLTLMVTNESGSDEHRLGDGRTIARVIRTLLHYAITATSWGRIALNVKSAAHDVNRVTIEIVDTGSGLYKNEIDNIDFPFQAETHHDRFGPASGLTFFLCKQLTEKLAGRLEIESCPEVGSRYTLELTLPQQPLPEQEEKLLDGVTVLVDVIVDDVRKIIVRQFDNWGANCIMPDERFGNEQHDLTVTDDPAHLQPWSLLLKNDQPGATPIAHGQYQVNFNISSEVLNAVLQLIEQRLAQEESGKEGEEPQELVQFFASGYFQLFKDTVPDDVRRLYDEETDKNYDALAQTAHRLKGVFAMLNLLTGKQLCERLEQAIRERSDLTIKNTTSEIDHYVNVLLQQGNPQNE